MAIRNISIKEKDIKGLIFDLNGTIVERLSKNKAHRDFFESYLSGININTFGKNSRSTREICEQSGVSFEDYCKYRDNHFDFKSVFAFSEDLFSALEKLASKYKLAIYTNATQKMTEIALQIGRVSRYFDVVLTCDDGYVKPNCEGFKRIMQELKTDSHELVMVGNNPRKDIHPFAKLGGNTVLVDNEKDFYPVADLFLKAVF